ncbi:MAG: epoxyqueuosine reductase QueH [Bacillota bacterium]|nr:epoxyqueuosine reductase QueH [Bacillota bacterium]
MNVLLHICCGPCSIIPVERLSEQGHKLTGFFYNPNIHPYREWRLRAGTLESFAGGRHLDVVFDQEYDLEGFLQKTLPLSRSRERCRHCYRMRLERSARFAAKMHADAFTSTLLVSPNQQHDVIREEAEALSSLYGVAFLYQDFRPGFRAGMAEAKALGLYTQTYCGCIFSERERYQKRHPGGEGGSVP